MRRPYAAIVFYVLRTHAYGPYMINEIILG